MEILGALLIGIAALAIIWLFRPGLKAAWAQTHSAEKRDWMGVLVPIAIVVLFVLFLLTTI